MTIQVLLVDDEPEVTAALRVALRPYDFDIATATSGEEGLRVLATVPIEVVVSDEQMIGMTGSEFLCHVRERFPDVARVVLTGRATMEETIAAINEAEVFRYLRKPSSPAELARCIEDAAETASLRRRRSSSARDLEADERAFDEARESIEMWFQPIEDRAGRVVAHEALLRTNHQDLTTPDRLIGAARTEQQKAALDRTVRRRVAEQLDHGWPEARVFVNLLPESLSDPEIVGDSGEDPLLEHAGRITLEITERASLSGMVGITSTVERLRTHGYQIALDDLGAGYAGLTSFSTLEPDVVKFDLELVRSIESRPWSARLISSMVDVCRAEGVQTVAEGIESPRELEALRELGVDLYQGYLMGKPAPPPTG